MIWLTIENAQSLNMEHARDPKRPKNMVCLTNEKHDLFTCNDPKVQRILIDLIRIARTKYNREQIRALPPW
jgi:hypothetical protein